MTDYKTAYEALAAAARRCCNWRFRSNLESDQADDLDSLSRCILDQAPAASEPYWSYGEDQSPAAHEVSVPPLRTATQVLADPPVLGLLPHDENYWLRIARREGDSEVGAGARPHGPVPRAAEPPDSRNDLPDVDSPDPDATEREHCERLWVQLQNSKQLPSVDVNLLLRERADAARAAAALATEAERQRCRDALILEGDGRPGWLARALERIASGEKP